MVIKSNGTKEEFNADKVRETIKTCMAQAGYDDGFDDIIDKLSLRAIARITRKRGDMDSLLITRYIRDTLIESGFTNVANKLNTAMYNFPDEFLVCQVHGIIPGRDTTCPKCGEPVKVYSLRSVAQKPETTESDLSASDDHRRRQAPQANPTSGNVQPSAKEQSSDATESNEVKTFRQKFYLFITPTCKGIDVLFNLLEEKGIRYRLMDSSNPEHRQYFSKYKVTQAPTLVIEDEDDYNLFVSVARISEAIRDL